MPREQQEIFNSIRTNRRNSWKFCKYLVNNSHTLLTDTSKFWLVLLLWDVPYRYCTGPFHSIGMSCRTNWAPWNMCRFYWGVFTKQTWNGNLVLKALSPSISPGRVINSQRRQSTGDVLPLVLLFLLKLRWQTWLRWCTKWQWVRFTSQIEMTMVPHLSCCLDYLCRWWEERGAC